MRRIITTYISVVLLVSLGFFGVGTLASAQQSTVVEQASQAEPAAAGELFTGR
jgi:amino acid permease